MPYANNYSRREKWSNSGKSGPVLMPPEPLPPWDRIRDRKHGYEHGHNHHNNNSIGGGGGGGSGRGGGRWRDSPSSTFAAGSRNSSEFSPRWGFPSDFRRPPGHIKPNGWHLYQEDSPQGYSTPRSNDRFLDDDGMRPSGPRGDNKYGRFYRDNRNGFGQKEVRGHSWENNRQYNGPSNTPGRPNSITSQRSFAESPSCPAHPNFDPNSQVHSKDQVDKTADANGSGMSPRLVKENSLGSLDWKPLKWARSGSMNSRGSGFSHSSSSKSNGGESNDGICDLAPKSVTPIESPSGDAAACGPPIAHSEDTSSRKKARLGWGEGLAKYEKKKVDGPEENVGKIENVDSVGNVGPTHSVNSTLADKSPKITGFSDCSSPATPSSFACSSSPGLEKTDGKTTDVDPTNFSVSSMPASENQSEGMQLRLDKLELNSITNLSSLLSQLLQVDDQCSMDSGFMRSSAFNKLKLWKGDISKALELTETEVDSLENELKLLKADSGEDDKDGQSDGRNGFARPLPLEVVSFEDMMIMDNTLPSHNGTRTHAEIKDDEIDSPGTATSKLEEPHSTQKPVSSCGWKNSCSLQDGFVESSRTVPETLISCINEKITEGTHQGDDPGVCSNKEGDICDIILNSNKSTASQASEVLIKLLPSDNNVKGVEEVEISCLPADTTIKEKFLRRKRLLKFKERVISLKYRAFHHLWKEDLRSLSSTSHRAKPQKKLDLISRSLQIGNQKHRPSIRSRFASPVGSSSLVPTTEVLNFTRKLLSDSEVKTYRSNLKMPAMFLDEKEKMASTFGSKNGLVEDPCAIEKERALINPWTIEEKELFMEKLSAFGKDFRKIASYLDHKTVADCVQFYYKNHKSECFQKTKKLDLKRQAKPLSSDTYMLTSGKKWGRDINSASLDVLGEASVIAAQADQAMKIPKPSSGKLSNKTAKGLDSNFNVGDDERETVAADVLAGICGSLSSEPMSSCITSSVRRPLTPDVTQSVDDEDNNDDDGTCSDESGGELGPVDWTDDEKSLFIQAFTSHGKDFLMVSRFVRTKTRDQCKVFFSKARKCLGLENVHPGSNDTNGGGSDVETGSVGCSNKSGSQMDEDVPHVSQFVSNPNSNFADLSTSEGNCDLEQLDCKDTEPEVLGPGDNAEVSYKSIESGDDRSKAHAAVNSLTGVSLRVSSVIDPETIAEVANGDSVSTCENKDSLVTNVPITCKQLTISCSSLANGGESEALTGLPLDLSAKAETNGDVTHKIGPESKMQSFQECYFRKCSRSVSQGSVSELSLLPNSEGRTTNDHAMLIDTSNSEKPCSSGGDVKIFGKILSKPCSVETTNHQLTPVCERDHNGFVGLENVPVRNYGIWDGSKIQVVSYPSSVNSSSSLLAKYPAAFGNGSVSQTEQQALQVPVNSGECHLNNACAFSPREFPVYRNQDRASPFMLDFKQRTNVLPCTAVSDPVAVLRSHYGGQSVNGVAREEAWGSQGDVGR